MTEDADAVRIEVTKVDDGNVMQLLEEPRPGVTEIFLHPATEHAELRALAPDWERRVDDHQLLTSAELRSALERGGVRLIGWRELRDLQRRSR